MNKTITLLTLFITLFTYAQDNFNAESYNVTKGDLDTQIFAKDSTANALMIYEHGESHIEDERFDLVFKKKAKLKILNKKGFDRATISVFLFNNGSKKERIDDIIATTYNNENGKIAKSKLTKDQIFEERYNDNYTIIKFTMPNVKEGSVITYSYTTTSPYVYKYKPWRFQDDIPKLYSEYNTTIPANYDYNIKLVGTLPLSVTDAKLKKKCVNGGNGSYADCTVSKYAIKDIPAFIDEDYMTTRDNYLSRIEYELKIVKGFDGSVDNITKTWKTTDKELKTDDNIGKQLKKGSLVKKLLPLDITSISDPLERAKAIYKYVQNQYTWDKEYNIYNDVSIKDLIKNKTGNVSEINFLLYNLLNENDIDTTPILASTRSNGFPTKIYPVISDFNYVLVQIDIKGTTYKLDATDPYLAFGQLPFRALNQYGRLLDLEDGSYWVNIDAKGLSSKSYKVELDLNTSFSGTMEYEANGYHSLERKRQFFSNPSAYKKTISESQEGIEIISHEVTVEEKNSSKFSEKMEIELESELVADNLYINPFLTTFFDENPFKLQERTYPIDFGFSDVYSYAYKLNFDPNKYELLETPESIAQKLPNSSGSLTLNVTKNSDNVMLFFKFNFKNAIYDSNFYPYLKEYFSKIIDAQKNSLIVLKKKN